jgi:hypothetical protein
MLTFTDQSFKPMYELAWLMLVPVAAMGYVIGKAVRLRSRKAIQSRS